jgi:hypothetical protein
VPELELANLVDAPRDNVSLWTGCPVAKVQKRPTLRNSRYSTLVNQARAHALRPQVNL